MRSSTTSSLTAPRSNPSILRSDLPDLSFSFFLFRSRCIYTEYKTRLVGIVSPCIFIFTMELHQDDWQARAKAKAAATLRKIPVDWRLDEGVIEDAKSRRQIAGDFILSLLDPDTVRCVSHDSKEIVDLIEKKVYTSVQMAQAFCKTAAVAHQLVRVNYDKSIFF